MNVSKLKRLLKDLPDDMEIILQKDSEGNGYSPLEGADPNGVYVPDSTWSGEVYDAKWSSYDAGMDDAEWEELRAKPRCLILLPVN